MITRRLAILGAGGLALTGISACGGGWIGASDTRKSIARAGLLVDAKDILDRLTVSNPEAAAAISNAEALLIFPRIVKGGFLVGAANGDGVWLEDNEAQYYYRSTSGSYGLQAGATWFGYVMAFMDQASLDYVQSSDGWEVGVGPNVVVADVGFAQKLSTTTLNSGVIVFFVDQAGFFAGAGIEGTKITRL